MTATAASPRARLRELLAGGQLILAPGIFDGLSALVAEAAGFGAIYLSGGAVARSSGVPDIGLLTLSEVLERTRQVTDAVRVPVIADADTGYGGVLNVARTVRDFERAGVAALHLEDQAIPKRCGHYENKGLVPAEEMMARLAAALDARSDPDLVLIARTDARAEEGLEAAIERAHRYAEAGADLIFVEAPQSREEVARIAAAVNAPLLINMFQGGKTPLIGAAELEGLGYRVAIVPSDLQRAAILAMQRVAEVLLRDGSSAACADLLAPFPARDALVRLDEYVTREETYENSRQGSESTARGVEGHGSSRSTAD